MAYWVRESSGCYLLLRNICDLVWENEAEIAWLERTKKPLAFLSPAVFVILLFEGLLAKRQQVAQLQREGVIESLWVVFRVFGIDKGVEAAGVAQV